MIFASPRVSVVLISDFYLRVKMFYPEFSFFNSNKCILYNDSIC